MLRKILVVEKSAVIRRQLEEAMQELRLQFVFETDGLKAFAKLLKEPYDALIVPPHVATIEAENLVAFIKMQKGPNQKTPAILIYHAIDSGGESEQGIADYCLPHDKSLWENLELTLLKLFPDCGGQIPPLPIGRK